MTMKMACVLAGLACILVMTAGCTSSPAAMKTPVPATEAASPVTEAANSPGGPALPWTGTWNTSWSEAGGEYYDLITLRQTGSSVEGRYLVGDGTVTGTVNGTSLVGTWRETSGNETAEGVFEFLLSGDTKSFSGRWAYTMEDLGMTRDTWNGVRI